MAELLIVLLVLFLIIYIPFWAIRSIVTSISMSSKNSCYICSQRFRGRSKKYVCRVEGKKCILCLRCTKKLERKISDQRFGEFFDQDSDNQRSSKAQKTKHKRKNISTPVKREVWQRDNGQCVECGSNELLEYDHIIPVSKGGANTVRNIQLLCQGCNRSKSSKIQ